MYRLREQDKELRDYQEKKEKKSTSKSLNAVSKSLPEVMYNTWPDKKQLK